MTSTLVSVIIPIFNGENDLADLLTCLLAQTYPRDRVEYILVDNNSSDRTGELLRRSERDLPIKLIIEEEKAIQSSYAARNRGIKRAGGELLLFTDADCRPDREWVGKMVAGFTDDNITIVVGEILALPGDTLLERYAEKNHILSQKFLLEHKYLPYGQTANLGIRKEVLKKVGLFRPYLDTGGDADLCWRILTGNAGKLNYNPEAIIYHRHRSTIKGLRSQFNRYGRSNLYLHELHGIDLTRSFTVPELFYRLGRWLLKEIPKNTVNFFRGKADIVDFINTPVDMIGFQARSQGQKTARLEDVAREIERFEG